MKKNHEILIASDHAGFELKNQIINYYKNNLSFKDLGTDNTNSCDYPVIA
ncbi:MAG: RpiB/LacA/LacB family sugar-phosphate isomerase, partial [Clostridia bacterium]|nr:RpiB/LacA/LacB family sugar-phosphate isomerase [Clostridia bacterium]